ncbi:MAG: glycosyltransferase family 39 protein [Pseudomonadota bacterium]|nr:glycosyltransferase family 39 protein [Pseudomonadota bacterium]
MTAIRHIGDVSAAQSETAQQPWLQRTLLVLGAILVLRLVSLWFNSTELFFDEAQYWAWGEEPAFGYFSKPPMLAWIIAGVTGVCGNSEFCVRLMSPLMHSGTALAIYFLAARLFDKRTGFWSAIVYATLPAVTLSSTLASTDVPLVFFWSLALLAFLRFEETGKTGWAVLLGVMLGAGLMSKYAMVYFLLCAPIYALAVPERPHVLKRPAFWLALAIGGLLLVPNLVWNLQNGFATVGHTGENIGWDGRLHFGRFAEFFGSQFGVMGPILFGIYLVAIFRLLREGMNRQQLFLLCFSVPVLALIVVQSLLSKAYANWAALTYVAATVLVTDLMINRIPDWWHRASLWLNGAVFAVIAIAVAFSAPGQLPLPDNLQPFDRMHGSRETAAALAKQADGNSYPVILVDNRRLASLMRYYLRERSERFASWRWETVPADHFEMLHAYQDSPEEPVLYATSRRNPHQIISSFRDVELLGDVKPSAGELGHVWFYALRGYAPAGSTGAREGG